MKIDPEEFTRNLAITRKNARAPKRAKPGRKRPRPGDEEKKMKIVEQIEQLSEHESEPDVEICTRKTEQMSDAESELSPIKRDPDMTLNKEEDVEDIPISVPIFDEHQQQDVEKNQISIQSINDSFSRDVRYSLEVWVPADGLRVLQNLNMSDKQILESKGWLNDVIMDTSMNLLKCQFPELEGFEPCYLAYNGGFKRHSNLFVQSLNRSKGSGSHWVTVSNINCLNDEIMVYDSAFDDLPLDEQIVISELVGTDSNVLKVKFADIQMQRNSYDCGLYAIANATALANGRYPAQESYNNQSTTMRRHLIGCIENKFLLPFPTHNTGYKSKRRQAKIKKILEMPLYCICKKPDTGTLYVYCDSCQKEYHPECLGISSSVNESTLVVCNTCRKKS